MDKRLEDLLKKLEGKQFKIFPDDLANLLIGDLQNRAGIKAMQLFILKKFSALTGQSVSELDKELKSFLETTLADEYSQFLTKRLQM